MGQERGNNVLEHHYVITPLTGCPLRTRVSWTPMGRYPWRVDHPSRGSDTTYGVCTCNTLEPSAAGGILGIHQILQLQMV